MIEKNVHLLYMYMGSKLSKACSKNCNVTQLNEL